MYKGLLMNAAILAGRNKMSLFERTLDQPKSMVVKVAKPKFKNNYSFS